MLIYEVFLKVDIIKHAHFVSEVPMGVFNWTEKQHLKDKNSKLQFKWKEYIYPTLKFTI